MEEKKLVKATKKRTWLPFAVVFLLLGGACVSGREYKENEQDIVTDWNKFNSVMPKSYDWKERTKTFDNYVTITENMVNVDGILYREQDLIVQIEQLKAEVAALKVIR